MKARRAVGEETWRVLGYGRTEPRRSETLRRDCLTAAGCDGVSGGAKRPGCRAGGMRSHGLIYRVGVQNMYKRLRE